MDPSLEALPHETAQSIIEGVTAGPMLAATTHRASSVEDIAVELPELLDSYQGIRERVPQDRTGIDDTCRAKSCLVGGEAVCTRVICCEDGVAGEGIGDRLGLSEVFIALVAIQEQRLRLQGWVCCTDR